MTICLISIMVACIYGNAFKMISEQERTTLKMKNNINLSIPLTASCSHLLVGNQFKSTNVKSECYIQVLCKLKPSQGTGLRHLMGDCRKTIAMRRFTN